MGLTASFPRNQDIACWIFNFPSNFPGITPTIADCRYGNVTGEHSAPKGDYPESCQTQKKTCSSRDVHWRKRVPNTNAATGRCRCRYFSRRPRWLISLPFRFNAQKISARVRSHSRTKTQMGHLRARMGGCVLQEEEMMRRWHGNCNNDEWMNDEMLWWMNVHIIIIIRHIIRGLIIIIIIMGGDICQPTPPLRALCLYQNSTRMIGQITPCQLMNVVYWLQVFLCLPCAGM